jgi:hypothetical protein
MDIDLERILKKGEQHTYKFIVQLLQEDKLEEGLELIELHFFDVERSVLESELIKYGLTDEEARFIVTSLASKYCKNYIMMYGFSKKVIENLQKTDEYKYIMK